MTDFLLELRSEEIPARMQDKARDDLARLFAAELEKAGLRASAIETFATPRRLALIARDLPTETAAVSEEVKGPRVGAPQAGPAADVQGQSIGAGPSSSMSFFIATYALLRYATSSAVRSAGTSR